MAKNGTYYWIVVESYVPSQKSGMHGEVHIRPIEGQVFPSHLHVECNKELSNNYPVGTKFRIKAKLTDRTGGGQFVYSYYNWKYEVIN